MSEYEKYNHLRVDITLRVDSYDYDDLQIIMDEPFRTNYATKVGFEYLPYVAGHDFVDFSLIFNFVLGGAATTLVSAISLDLYNWTKKSLIKVFKERERFEESRINLVFLDRCVTIYIGSKEELELVLMNMENIIEFTSKVTDDVDTVSVDEIKHLFLNK